MSAAPRCRTEFIERKSRFITTIGRVSSVEEYKKLLGEVRAEFPDATHHCAAYRLRSPLVERFFDDGEPSGTAGMPMLEVLKRAELFDTAVIATRYFGGVLLGAGGLTRAYSRAAREGVQAAGSALLEPAVRLEATADYGLFERLQRLLSNLPVQTEDIAYGGEVVLTLLVRRGAEERLAHEAAELSAGTVRIRKLTDCYGIF